MSPMRAMTFGLVNNSVGLIGQGGNSSPPHSAKKLSGRHAASLPSQKRCKLTSSLPPALSSRSLAYLLTSFRVTSAPSGILTIFRTTPLLLLTDTVLQLP